MSSIELQDLAIDEVSGVDAPANAVPGWMVIKSEDGAIASAEAQLASLYAGIAQATALDGAPENVRKAAEILAGYAESQLSDEDDPNETLIQKMKRAFKKQDKAVKKAVKQALAEADVEKASDETRKPQLNNSDANDEDDDADDNVAKALGEHASHLESVVEKAVEGVSQDLDIFREVIEKMLDRLETVEDMVVGSSQAMGQEYAPVVEKSAPTLRDAILSAAAGNRVTIN